MTRTICSSLFALLLTVPASAEPGSQELPRLKSTLKVRPEWAARYQDSRYGPEVAERFTRTIRLGRSGSVDVSNVAGDIVVTGGTGADVRIEAVKRARARADADARAILRELEIEVLESPSRVEIRTGHPRNRRNYSGAVDYTITVPSGAAANIRSVSGDIRVTNVRGELRAESVSGDVTASGSTRLALVKSVSGDVEVTDAATEGEVTVSTVSGDVVARGLKARSVELGSVSGDVKVTNITSQRASVKTVSGAVEYAGALARGGRYEITAHSGSVRLAIGGNTGFELDATTFSGEVRSDFAITMRSASAAQGRGRRSQSVRGTYGDGSAIVSLKSFSGDIVLTRR